MGLLSRTRYEWTLVDYASWWVGAVTVPIYETSSAEQVRWILQDSGATAVACVEEPAEQASGRVGPRRRHRPAARVGPRRNGSDVLIPLVGADHR